MQSRLWCKIMKFPGKLWHNLKKIHPMPDLETKESASVVRDAMTFATGLMWHSVHCICRPTRLHVSDFRWPSASSRRVCAARALYHMQMREWYYTKGEFSKCHSARKLWEILCFERVLHSSPRPPRADWRDAIANPIKTHDSVFTTCRSFLASVGFNCFCRTFQLLITIRDFCWFSEPKSEIKAAVSLSDFGARQLINLFVFFFAAVH